MKVDSSVTINANQQLVTARGAGAIREEPVREGAAAPVDTGLGQGKNQLDARMVNDAVEKLNKTARIFNKSLHFRFHKEAKRWQVQVMNLDTGEVIREIPPSEILDVVAKIQEIVGVFVDERR
ncbi:flagellar protein FlaG protein [Thermincola ferriacetica]|uniref:Flagellar protein FlaG protein n=1 Tax=Thermincola ferriacetica TaxID=281456 RepID=A0A0L6W3E4_9FIRM|nr:flagellar protein FlaG [Thermincola ferriacetica]KNZ70102.1 flagellar protein FlaG protein [Thermincola ferriacetica]